MHRTRDGDEHVYLWVVRRKVATVWRRVGDGDFAAAVEMAADDVAFRFHGDTALGAELSTRADFSRWFAELFRIFPGIRLTATDIVATGWPWATTVAVRLRVQIRLRDGSHYENTATQWMRIRWGRMISDEVIEDTLALSHALKVQGYR